jgi:hypothetical protein
MEFLMYKMLSDEFVREHRNLISKHAVKMFAKDHRGAFDVTTSPYTKFTKGMSNSRGDKQRDARDQWENPNDLRPNENQGMALDPATMRALVNHIRDEWGQEACDSFLKRLNESFPGAYREEGENGDYDTPDQTTRFVEDEDFPETTGKQVGGPVPSTMADDASFYSRFPDAARIGMDKYGVPSPYDSYGRPVETSVCEYDNYGRRIDGLPRRNSKSGRSRSAPMALDARTERDYAMAFGKDAMRIKFT